MKNSTILLDYKTNIGVETHSRFKRGWLLTEIKDNKLYKGKADSFKEFLSQADVRSDARDCMDLYKFYVQKHGLHIEDIQDIHHLRLLEAKKAITKQPDKLWEWLDNCRVLSWMDLINEVREARGLSQMPRAVAVTSESAAPPCCICGGLPSEQAHWPITKKMGGEFTIPLCRECHDEYHQHGDVTFYDHYKRKIGEWLAKQRETE